MGNHPKPARGEVLRPLHVLMVEDSEPDAQLLAHALERGGFHPIWERIDTAEAMEALLEKKQWDLILADHAMPCFSAPEALELVKKRRLDVPFIIVSGHIDETTAVASMKAGAHDYVTKQRLARLVPAVERELREAEVRRARSRSEEELRRTHEELETRVEKRTAALRAANIKLQKALEVRRRLESELLEIAENERRSIGFDLHDDLGQRLTGLSLMAKGLEQKLIFDGQATSEDAHKIHLLIQELIQHTHNLAHEFSSLDATGDDLCSVLKGLSGNVQRMFSTACDLRVRGEVPELPGHTTVQLYKITQEAVSNAIKHGKATGVSIDVARSGSKLVLSVTNDGLPFAASAKAKTRMGLRIMNYRANTIGASLDIKPLNASGTVVTCTLPVKGGLKREAKSRRGPAESKSNGAGVPGERGEACLSGSHARAA